MFRNTLLAMVMFVVQERFAFGEGASPLSEPPLALTGSCGTADNATLSGGDFTSVISKEEQCVQVGILRHILEPSLLVQIHWHFTIPRVA